MHSISKDKEVFSYTYNHVKGCPFTTSLACFWGKTLQNSCIYTILDIHVYMSENLKETHDFYFQVQMFILGYY